MKNLLFIAGMVLFIVTLGVAFAPDACYALSVSNPDLLTPDFLVQASLIESFTGVTEKRGIQIERSCKSITIITKTNAIAAAVKVSLSKVHERGTKQAYTDMPILDLAEIMAQGEGLFIKDTTGYQGSFPASAKSLLKIPVTDNMAAVNTTVDDYLSLDLTGLTSGTTYEVYSDESLELGGRLIDIDRMAVAAPRVNQKFKVEGASLIALPKTNFSKVQLFGKNGNDVVYDAVQLAVDSIFENDLVAGAYRTIATTPAVVLTDAIFGYDNLFIINVENVSQFEVYCTGAAGYEFYVVKYGA